VPSDPTAPQLCGPPQTLQPGESQTCTRTFTVTAADVAAGGIGGFAAMGDLFDPDLVDLAGTVATTSTSSTPWFVQGAGSTSYTPAAGEDLHLAWTITQLGAGALHDAAITTDLPGASAVTCTPTLGPGSTIGVGGSAECSATYPLTQTDIDAGEVAADWQAATDSDASGPEQRSGTITVPIRGLPTLSAQFTATPSGPLALGEVTHLQITGTNTSDVTLTDVQLTGSLPGLSGASCSPALPATLAPHTSVTCTLDLTITQADVDDNPAYTLHLAADTDAHGPATDATQYRPLVTRTGALTVQTTGAPASGLGGGGGPAPT
jgi:hypothetical protein